MRQLLSSLDDEALEVMQKLMMDWRERRRGGRVVADGGSSLADLKENVSTPLGAGEWDETVGLPICVVCQNVGGWGFRWLICEDCEDQRARSLILLTDDLLANAITDRPTRWNIWRKKWGGGRRILTLFFSH